MALGMASLTVIFAKLSRNTLTSQFLGDIWHKSLYLHTISSLNHRIQSVFTSHISSQDPKIHRRVSLVQFGKHRVRVTNTNMKQIDCNDPDSFGSFHAELSDSVYSSEKDTDAEIEKKYPKLSQDKRRMNQFVVKIKDYLKQKKIAEAIDVLETEMLKVDRVKPEYHVYTILITACAQVGYAKKAFNLYNQMKKRGLRVTASVYTSLFNACANSPFPKDALKRANHLRDLMVTKNVEPNATHYHAMIKAFGRCGDLNTAFILADEMVEHNHRLTPETFNFLLQACISDKEAGFRHTLLVWQKLMEKGVSPNIYSFNLLLRSTRDCGLGDGNIAQDVLNKIVQGTEVPKTKFGNADPLLVTSESKTNLTTPIASGGSIVAVSEVTRPEHRLLILGGHTGLLQQMEKAGVKANVKTITLLLDVIPPTILAEEALLAAAKKLKVALDVDFYNMLIKKRSMRFDYANAHKVLQLIQEEKLNPDIVTFGVLALGCRGQKAAEMLLADMDAAGFRLNAEILGAMIGQACHRWDFYYALTLMEIALREDVYVTAQLVDRLDKFHSAGWDIINEKMKYPNGSNKDTFNKQFKVFRLRYKAWKTEVKHEKVQHPWLQFKKTSAVSENV